jgi:hypothetical protein
MTTKFTLDFRRAKFAVPKGHLINYGRITPK